MQYEYFYGAQAEQFSFYRIPKALFTEPNFRELSTDAKVFCRSAVFGTHSSGR